MSVNTRIVLENELVFQLEDRSTRYFGDYHHACLAVTCDIPLSEKLFGNCELLADGLRMIGPKLCYRKEVKKMAVPTANLEATLQGLVENFTLNFLPYFRSSEFLEKFLQAELSRCRKGVLLRPSFFLP